MKPAFEQYTEDLHQRFGYLAAWLPNTPIELGDVGKLTRERFERVTTLAQLGAPLQAGAPGSPADYEYCSADAVDIALQAQANGEVTGVPASGAATMNISFKRANAVVFVARGCRSRRVDNRDELGQWILARHKAGEWPADHVVVTEVIQAQSATVLISSSEGAGMSFEITGKAGLDTLQLADASGSLRLMASSGIGTRIVAARNLTPLFRAAGVRQRLLRGATFDTRGSAAGGKRRGAVFLEAGYPED